MAPRISTNAFDAGSYVPVGSHSVPEPVNPVHSALLSLDAELSALFCSINVLEDRLNLVLTPSIPVTVGADSRKEQLVRPIESALTSQLAEYVSKIRDCHGKIVTLTDSLEI